MYEFAKSVFKWNVYAWFMHILSVMALATKSLLDCLIQEALMFFYKHLEMLILR